MLNNYYQIKPIYIKNITFDDFNNKEQLVEQFITTKMNDLQNKIDNNLI